MASRLALVFGLNAFKLISSFTCVFDQLKAILVLDTVFCPSTGPLSHEKCFATASWGHFHSAGVSLDIDSRHVFPMHCVHRGAHPWNIYHSGLFTAYKHQETVSGVFWAAKMNSTARIPTLRIMRNCVPFSQSPWFQRASGPEIWPWDSTVSSLHVHLCPTWT